MLHPEFDRICRLCKELSLNIIILSNLTCCDGTRIQLLKEIEPQFVSVSLYSMDPSVHDRITCVPGSWKKTMSTILACEKAGIRLRIATPLLKENKDSFPALESFAKTHHTKLSPNFMIFAKSDGATGNLSHVCSPVELERTLSDCKDIFGSNLIYGHEAPWDDRVCRIGMLRLCVNSCGDYYPCDGMHGYVLGNASSHSLDEVWGGEKLTKLRSLKVGDFKICRSCPDRKFCLVCPAFNYNATGDLLMPYKTKCEAAGVVRRVYGEEKQTC